MATTLTSRAKSIKQKNTTALARGDFFVYARSADFCCVPVEKREDEEKTNPPAQGDKQNWLKNVVKLFSNYINIMRKQSPLFNNLAYRRRPEKKGY